MMIAIAEVLSAVAAVLILSSTFPQAVQTIKTRLTRDISMKFLSICVCGQIAWTVYAIVTHQPIFIIGEGVDMALWGVVLTIKLFNVRNGKDKEEHKEEKCDCQCHKCKEIIVEEMGEIKR